MSGGLISLAKNNKAFYSLYYILGTLFLRFLRFFVRPKPRLILFVSYGGRQYSDSPKAIYEEVLKDHRFDNFELVWAFREPEKIELPGRARKIKIDSIPYYKIALGARVWITNVAIERGLNFKGKHTFYLCTWHGSPIKKLWFDLKEHGAKVFVPKNPVNFDMLCAQSPYDVEVFSSAFRIDKSKIVMTGLPRNDVLVNPDESIRRNTRRDLGIKDDQIMVLYAPTYRDYDLEEPIFHPMLWDFKLDERFHVFFKGHHLGKNLKRRLNFPHVQRVPASIPLPDLMLASDILVSDYSSVFFDYSILKKPIFCYAPDQELFAEKRGMYINPKDIFSEDFYFTNEEELIEAINNYDMNRPVFDTIKIKDNFVEVAGGSTGLFIDELVSRIKNFGIEL